MHLPGLITVYEGQEPPRLKPNGYMDEWKPIDLVLTPLTVFKLVHIELLDRGGKEIDVTAVPAGSPELKGIRFPLGGPEPKVVYERHDATPSRYLLPSTKDEVQLSERLHAYSAGFAALGARRISVSVTEDRQATGSVNLEARGAEIRAHVGHRKSTDRSTSCEMSLPGHAPRRLPKSPWLDTEEWRYIEQARRLDGLETYRFNFRSSENRSLNAELAAEVLSCGLKLGGDYTSLGLTEFVMSADF